ncbi:MAG: hypothetical protein ACJAU9_000535 [Lentimonas sp.]|jgi:hypothetical protein
MITEINSAVTETLLYHKQTKYHFHRYARSAGTYIGPISPTPSVPMKE